LSLIFPKIKVKDNVKVTSLTNVVMLERSVDNKMHMLDVKAVPLTIWEKIWLEFKFSKVWVSMERVYHNEYTYKLKIVFCENEISPKLRVLHIRPPSLNVMHGMEEKV
jgi:hypothetical protein